MADAPLRLYGEPFWISPYVFTCFVALREKGLPFETDVLPLHERAQRAPAYRDRSITAKVPALEHDGFWLAESSAIVEYLEDAFPGARVLPSDFRARARARQLQAWIRSALLALREERPTTTMFYERAATPLSPAGREAAAELVRVADLVVPARGGALFGAWCVADADLAFMLHRLLLNDEPVPSRIADWARAEWERPSVRAFVTHERPPAGPPPY
ncbi:MAG TPA: glutathione transferase [Candidatus Binatia bacterium]|nr:glutathione transferase [Candidatus Binatia bacterium]